MPRIRKPKGQQPSEGAPELSKETSDQMQQDAAFVSFWADQLDSYKLQYENWEKRVDRIVERYRDDNNSGDGAQVSLFKFNSLWSNIQTLQPAIYKNPPKPVIERRYLDKDPLARYASMTLERASNVMIQDGKFDYSVKKAVLDYLLGGRGQTWNRYEPTYGTPLDLGPTDSDDEGTDEGAPARAAPEGDGDDNAPKEAPRPVTWEKVCQDHVPFKNFRHSPVATWDEVWWVSKCDYMTRRELRTRFKGKDPVTGKPIADLIPLKNMSFKDWNNNGQMKETKGLKRAAIWEIWDKNNREVCFISLDYQNGPLERTPDPLKLQEFWPCGRPLYATMTNETLIPVPDYSEYQDQAEELDNLTARIHALTDAIKVVGVYDSSIAELKRILSEGTENVMIGVAKWDELASGGGLKGKVDFFPLKDVVDALIRLYEARDRVKADMAEITGMSDIVRGQSQGPAKTATEQQIKGRFASLRLEDRQAEVARFCRDNLAISAEITAEQFSVEILAEMTAVPDVIAEDIRANDKLMQKLTAQLMPPAPPPQAPGLMGPGMPPQGPMPGAMPPGAPPQPLPPPPQEAIDAKVKATAFQIFEQVVKLLRDDKMRTFRIDVETDSTVAIDKQGEKQSVIELITAMGGTMDKMVQVGQIAPEMIPALGATFMFAFRRFGVGRDVEGAWEQAIEKMVARSKNPPAPQPNPDMIRAAAEKEKQDAENRRADMEAQAEMRSAAMEQQREQENHRFEQQQQQLDLVSKNLDILLKKLDVREKELENLTPPPVTEVGVIPLQQ